MAGVYALLAKINFLKFTLEYTGSPQLYTCLRKIININKIVRFTMRKSVINDFWVH